MATENPEETPTAEPGADNKTGGSEGTRITEAIASAYREYVRAIQKACDPADARRRYEEAHLRYVKALLEAGNDQVKRFEAQLCLSRELHEAAAPEEVRRLCDAAFRDFVRACQSAWAELDIDAVEPSVLVSVGQTLATVGAHAPAVGAGKRSEAARTVDA